MYVLHVIMILFSSKFLLQPVGGQLEPIPVWSSSAMRDGRSDPFVFLAMGSYTLLIFKELQRETALILMTQRYTRGWQLNYWLPIILA